MKDQREIYKALLDGKTIECLNKLTNTWEIMQSKHFITHEKYRIRPEGKAKGEQMKAETLKEMLYNGKYDNLTVGEFARLIKDKDKADA